MKRIGNSALASRIKSAGSRRTQKIFDLPDDPEYQKLVMTNSHTQVSIEQLKAVHAKTHPAETPPEESEKPEAPDEPPETPPEAPSGPSSEA